MGEPATYWQALAVAADQGQLYLNPAAAQVCSAACDEYILKLENHQREARVLANISGYGDFKSGTELRDMFAAKAVGGEDNMVDVLQSHIDVVDDTNAADVRAQGPK